VKQFRLPDSKPSSSAILACKLPEIATVKRHVLTLQLHVYFLFGWQDTVTYDDITKCDKN
jgi:hypothetical protein